MTGRRGSATCTVAAAAEHPRPGRADAPRAADHSRRRPAHVGPPCSSGRPVLAHRRGSTASRIRNRCTSRAEADSSRSRPAASYLSPAARSATPARTHRTHPTGAAHTRRTRADHCPRGETAAAPRTASTSQRAAHSSSAQPPAGPRPPQARSGSHARTRRTPPSAARIAGKCPGGRHARGCGSGGSHRTIRRRA